jgi:cytochrome c-type biogenesis protein
VADGELLLGAVSALWLGVLTSVAPCPLATNIAAVSFIARRMNRPAAVVVASGLYTAGRTMAYVVLAAATVWALMSMVGVSTFLQGTFHKLLGPLLILVGMLLLELIRFDAGGGRLGEIAQQRADRLGLLGTFPLGAVLALSFCPVSAGLFFGSLVPLAAAHSSPLLLPTLYAVGTALPVVGFALLVLLGATWLGAAFTRVAAFELWARRVTGAIFILVGIYETLRGVFHVL